MNGSVKCELGDLIHFKAPKVKLYPEIEFEEEIGMIIMAENVDEGTEIAVEKGIKPGSRVTKGQVIGATKKMSSQSMLHIEIYPSSDTSIKAADAASGKKPKATNIIGDNKEMQPDKMDHVNDNQYKDGKKNIPFERPKNLHDPSIFAALSY